ncbi:MAG: phage major capsid protein [Candidatus Gastranaerophilales bacterium]|nr:phage major capsid protein [Candidatus Gastranaerophilales bacterium]
MTQDALYISRSGAETLIPTEVSNEIIQNLPGSSAALKLFRRLPNMSAKQQTLPIAATLPNAYFLNGDTAQKKTSNAEWSKLTLTAEEIAVIIPIPEAVIDDASYDIWAALKPQIAEAFGVAIDAAVFFGTNKPTSFPTAIVTAALAAGNYVAAGTNSDIAEDIIGENGLMAKVEECGYKVTGFYADSSLEAKFRSLRDNNGQLIYMPSLTSAAPNTLVGRPLTYDEVGGIFDTSTALMVAGDFSKAVYSIRQDLTYKVLDQAIIQNTDGTIAYNLAQQDMVALRCVMRLGVQVANPVNRRNKQSKYPFAILTPEVESTTTTTTTTTTETETTP